MKIKWTLFYVFIFLLLPCLLYAEEDRTELKLIYISKVPEIEPNKKGVGGLPELGSMLRQARAKNEHVMFLHGGDSLAPSAMSSFDQGTHMIDVLNSLEPDVFAINEREFAYQEDELILRVAEAAFPFVSSNLYDPLSGGNLEGVSDFACFNYGQHQVCTVALLDPLVITNYLPDRIVVNEDLGRVKKLAKILREDGADVIILLTGFPLDELENLIEENYVDVVFWAHSELDEIRKVGDKIHGLQGSTEGKALEIDLILKNHGDNFQLQSSGNVVQLNNFPPDKEVREKINYYVNRLSSIMDVEIGDSLTSLDTTYNSVRTQENAFANMVADSLRDYYKADVAIVNGGSIRGNRLYAPGTRLTRKIIQSELPFLNESRLIQVTGEQLREALENGLSLIEEKKGRFLHLSGMTMSYCQTAPVGKRVNKVWVGQKELEPNDTYSLAANHYLINGGDGFGMLKKATPLKSTQGGTLIWNVTRSYIEKLGSVSPVVEGRLLSECR